MGIQVLDPEVVGKIAAGEVVERPASAVKELIENALDAGARSIQVELAAGGCDLIVVSDDGRGVARDDMRLAVERHATSKIRSADDLVHVTTLGFRGEALASIAAVSEFTLTSREASGTVAYQLSVSGGAQGKLSPVGRAPGTTVQVERLFFNFPARRKFLKSASAEGGQIARLMGQFALAYPEVAFVLITDGRRTLSTDGSGGLLGAAASVLGKEAAGALVPIEAAVEPDRTGGLAARITGYVGDPKLTRSTRSSIWLFVNRRPIQSRALTRAVEDGFATLVQVGRYPVAILNLEVPSEEVDVNVHPAKAEVRLLKERLIYGGLRDAVRAAVSAGSGWAKEVTPDESMLPWGAGDSFAPRLLDVPPAPPAAGGGVLVGGRRLPILRVIGQVAQTYIIAEGEGGIFLIDQHAAHERVLLERLTKSLNAEGNTQLSLEPLVLELTPIETQVLETSKEVLESLGYRLEPFGDSSVLVRGIPTGLPEGKAIEALKETLAELGDERPAGEWRERVLISLSCRGAVKAGQTLAPEEMRSLVLALEEMDITQHCSHGRPTAILLSRTQLEKEFGRR
ncbi:MAG TPA: DNA mismatch repair endonuclease MutL [Chloroflexota bacterium]